jgi:hypothetical protein
MSETIIFIDDEVDSRTIYEDILQDIYGDEYSVNAIHPQPTIGEMISELNAVPNLVSIVIDEKLQVGKAINYQGSELADALRGIDSKLPLYILTSETSLIVPPLGSVEYVIDKTLIEVDEYKRQCSMLMRRHINSFNDIKSVRAARFDDLLKKSIEHGLSAEEKAEYKELDFIRVKPILAAEDSGNTGELDRQQALIELIEGRLKELEDK